MGRRPLPVTEAAFTRQVIALARLRGWRAAHFRPGRTARGWRTPVQGEGVGFLDLVLVRGRVVWAELKSARGRLTGFSRRAGITPGDRAPHYGATRPVGPEPPPGKSPGRSRRPRGRPSRSTAWP